MTRSYGPKKRTRRDREMALRLRIGQARIEALWLIDVEYEARLAGMQASDVQALIDERRAKDAAFVAKHGRAVV